MTPITIQVELPPGITITNYQRHTDGHGFEIDWPHPERCRCDSCGREEKVALELPNKLQVVRDLELWGQPSFWVYQPAYHRCPWCNHRQSLTPPFKRHDVSYTYRFEQHVLRLLIGSTEEEVARRLGVSAEMVGLIVRHQLADTQAKEIAPERVITDVGIDELSLKKRHRLYATILTDLTNPAQPEVLAVAEGRDEAAARKCLEKLSETQRQQVETFRADMSQAYHTACRALLPNAKPVVDRFHVAKKFGEVIDQQRKTITRAYKATLSKAERKEFRSLMWEFRRRPEELSPAEQQKLEGLFHRLPRLRTLYGFRGRFQKIFDTKQSRGQAKDSLLSLFVEMLDFSGELDRFIKTYEHWEEEILNYFVERKTSGVVEGINNKARGILKRAYGLRSAESLWTRLILDLNRAKDVVLYSIDRIREVVAEFRVAFACT